MAALIAYFSRAGNNYVSGAIQNLEVGNTEIVAKMINKLTGSDLFKIDPLIAYSEDYSECIQQAKQDKKRNARPELKDYPENLDQYDTIYLGFPNYWDTMPMAVFTFLDKYDLTEKTIKPFCTHEGSGMGTSESDIKSLCKQAIIEEGIAIQGGKVNDSEPIINKWILIR